MSAQPCLPQDIISMNRNKEYTLIATDLLESVLTDPRLNAQTSKLWQILFNKARYTPDLSIKLSYAYLADKLGKSIRTIARYMESLQNSGYLILTHNFDKNGGQRPSTISVRVPQFSIEHAKKKKDRLNKNSSINNEVLIKSKKEPVSRPENYNHKNYPVNATESLDTAKNEIVLHGTILDINDDLNDTSPLEVIDLTKIPNEKPFPEDSNKVTIKDIRKIDRGGHDINVIQIDNNKKDINKNNNNVVVPFLEEVEKTKALQQEISHLEQQLSEGNKQISTIKNNELLYDQIKRNSRIEASLHLAKIALDRQQKNMIENAKQNEINSKLTNNPNFIQEKAGDRHISKFTFKRLVKTLMSYGYSGTVLNALTNEIVFEVRFGTLINCNKTNKPLSLDNAINIGLKLVREKRWSTPKLLEIKNNIEA